MLVIVSKAVIRLWRIEGSNPSPSAEPSGSRVETRSRQALCGLEDLTSQSTEVHRRLCKSTVWVVTGARLAHGSTAILCLLRQQAFPYAHPARRQGTVCRCEWRGCRDPNDQSKQPSLDPDREPNLTSRKRSGRVCEPYALDRMVHELEAIRVELTEESIPQRGRGADEARESRPRCREGPQQRAFSRSCRTSGCA
jgi:hypothetical protein